MIFQHTHAWILQPSPHTGALKTQTRRIVKPGQGWAEALSFGVIGKHAGEVLESLPNFTSRTPYKGHEIYAVHFRGRKASIYQVGKSCAVQPGRGQRAIGRIRITGIRREDVRDISDEDARAEGFASKWQFWETWTEMHDPRAYKHIMETTPAMLKVKTDDGREQWMFSYLKLCPAERYDAWVLTFEAEAQS